PPPPAARQALMARVSATVRDAPRAQREVTMATALRPAGWPSSWGAAAGWTAALACAAVAAASAWQLALTRGELATLRQDRAAAESRLQAQAEVLGQLDPQVTRVAALRGSAQAAAIQGRVVFDANSPTALA